MLRPGWSSEVPRIDAVWIWRSDYRSVSSPWQLTSMAAQANAHSLASVWRITGTDRENPNCRVGWMFMQGLVWCESKQPREAKPLALKQLRQALRTGQMQHAHGGEQALMRGPKRDYPAHHCRISRDHLARQSLMQRR